MQRYFIYQDRPLHNEVNIAGEHAHHILNVMRMKPDDNIVVVDAKQQVAYKAEIIETSSQPLHVKARLMEQQQDSPELPVKVDIVQSLIKKDHLDWVVQKGTELGAAAFYPYNAVRSVVKWEGLSKVEKKLVRLRKIAEEAAEQSERLKVPEVHAPLTLDALIETSHHYTYCIIAYEESSRSGHTDSLPELFRKMECGSSLLCVIGPEGGFAPQEIEALKNAGFMTVGLGPRILRAETAPHYILSAVSFYFELLKEVD